jgi:hypothetical protein
MVLHVVQLNPPRLVGSTLLPLTTSGGSSGAVSPTGGRYGSVTIDASHWFNPWCRVLVLMCIRQIYSLSRFNALLSIILFFVTFDVTTPINCQVGTLIYVCHYLER